MVLKYKFGLNTLLFSSMLFISCKDRDVRIKNYENGKIKLKTSYSLGGNALKSEFYDRRGYLKSIYYFDNNLIDSLSAYHSNGELYKTGNIINGKKNGWWSVYDTENNLIERNEYIIKDNALHKNQAIHYKTSKKVDSSRSSFYNVNLPEKITEGKNIGFIRYN